MLSYSSHQLFCCLQAVQPDYATEEGQKLRDCHPCSHRTTPSSADPAVPDSRPAQYSHVSADRRGPSRELMGKLRWLAEVAGKGRLLKPHLIPDTKGYLRSGIFHINPARHLVPHRCWLK